MIKKSINRYYFLIPIIFLIIFFNMIIFYFANNLMTHEVEHRIKEEQSHFQNNVKNEIAKSIDIMTYANNNIVENGFVTVAFTKNSQELMLQQVNGIFENFNHAFGISHLNFISTEGRVFLRVHDRLHFGDIISRKSFKEAERTQKTAFAIEGGLNGFFTLRVVTPWYKNNKLIGYIEMGRDISNILGVVSKDKNIETIATINKNLLNHEQYQKDIAKNKQVDYWNLVKAEVPIIYTASPPIWLPHLPQILDNDYIDKGISLSKIEFTDGHKLNLGHLFFVVDVSKEIDYARKIKLGLGLICLLQIIFILCYFNYLINKNRRDLKNINILSKFATIGESTSSLAHDIVGQLTVITSYMEFLLKKTKTDEPNYKIFEKIIKATNRIERMANSNRRIAKMGNETQEDRGIHNLSPYIEDVIEVSQISLNKFNIKLLVDPAQFNIEVKCDPTQISQVLLNLINNARDEIAHLSDEKWIKVDLVKKLNTIEFSVANSGPLIPSTIREKLFVEYFTTKDSDSGTGLGLNICKNIINDHQGEINCSENTIYTTFVFSLPIL